MNKAEREHLDRVASLGCICCLQEGHGYVPAMIHHINSGAMGKKSSHFETIGLCKIHHQQGPMGVAVHAGKRTWEAIHGTERDLLKKVQVMLHSQLSAGDEDPTLEHGGIPCPTQSSTSLPTSQPSNTPSLPPMATIPSGTNLLSPSDGSSLPSGSDQHDTLDCTPDCPGCLICQGVIV